METFIDICLEQLKPSGKMVPKRFSNTRFRMEQSLRDGTLYYVMRLSRLDVVAFKELVKSKAPYPLYCTLEKMLFFGRKVVKKITGDNEGAVAHLSR